MAEINGLADLVAAIQQKKDELAAELPAIVQAASEPIRDEIDARLPRATGDMEKHLETVVTADSRSAQAIVQISHSAVGDIEQKAVFKEFGTSKMPAEPSFRPGFQAGKERAFAALAQGVARVLLK